jgi:predicted RNase H-like HicB family nuclease
MLNIQHADLSSYRLPLEIEQMEDGSFMATSPALEGFLVLADTVEEVISLAPSIAKSLIEAMHSHGITPALDVEELSFPVKVEVLVV